jgi:hypothetical protein
VLFKAERGAGSYVPELRVWIEPYAAAAHFNTNRTAGQLLAVKAGIGPVQRYLEPFKVPLEHVAVL